MTNHEFELAKLYAARVGRLRGDILTAKITLNMSAYRTAAIEEAIRTLEAALDEDDQLAQDMHGELPEASRASQHGS
jgi:hypothetical protein